MTVTPAILVIVALGAAAGALLERIATRLAGRRGPPTGRTLLSAVVMALLVPALAFSSPSPAQLVCDLALLCVLAVATLTDLETRRIPNLLTGSGIAGMLALTALLQPQLVTQRLLFALLGFTFFFAAALLRPGGLGVGDVKLVAVIGAALGALALPAVTLALLGAAAAGAAIALRDGLVQARAARLPLAPFLGAGAVVTLLVSG